MSLANVLVASTDSVIPFLRSMLPRLANAPAAETIVSDPTGLRAVAHRAWPTDSGFADAWDDLLARVPDATVFQTAHWQQAILGWPQRLDRLVMLAIWRGSRLIGVLPLQSARGRRLESAGAIVSDYLDPLIDPADEEAAWRSIFSFLREKPATAQTITLRNLRPQSSARATLRASPPRKGLRSPKKFTAQAVI